MAVITVQTATKESPLSPTYAACSAGGDTFANNGRVMLHFKNANLSTARVVTIDSLVACSYGFDHDVTVTVPADGDVVVGFLEINRFNDAQSDVSMTYDNEADLTVAAIKIS